MCQSHRIRHKEAGEIPVEKMVEVTCRRGMRISVSRLEVAPQSGNRTRGGNFVLIGFVLFLFWFVSKTFGCASFFFFLYKKGTRGCWSTEGLGG